MDKIFLIDGHAQIFRMYYAFMRHPLINSKGKNTSILYGFTKMLLELVNKEHPTHIAVAFDSHAPTFRHAIYKEYKANRPPAPEEVIDALEPLKEILTALNIKYIMQDGVEADDIIGSMSAQWGGAESQIYMVTPDKDYGQLINENVFQYKLPKGGTGDIEVVGEKEICGQYGIASPRSVVDILAIWGDSSDNVPGVKGIGEVGAKKLIGKYGTMESLLEHLDELPAKQQANIQESREWLPMSKFLVTIKRDVELPVAKEDITIKLPNKQLVDQVFEKYEFNSLKKQITEYDMSAPAPLSGKEMEGDAQDAESEDIPEDFPTDNMENAEIPHLKKVSAKEFAESALESKEIGIETVNERALVLATKENYCVTENIFTADALEDIKEVLQNEQIAKCGNELKGILKLLKRTAGIDLKGPLYDIGLLHYIVNPELNHSTEFIFRERLNVNLTDWKPSQSGEDESNAEAPGGELDLFSAQAEIEEDGELTEAEGEKGGVNASLSIVAKEVLIKALGEKADIYKKIEMPLICTLAQMELTGVKIDTTQLAQMSKELTEQMNAIEESARALAQDPSLNLSSSKQVGILLYERLKVDPKVRKTVKGNYHTDETTLKELESKHPIINQILEFRNLRKLLSTYIDALPELIDPLTGKVHTTFTQALTVTGRLSSVNPNLQNIPVRTERGREIRKAFIPSDPDGYIVSADYSQIELRLMAHFSGDESLIEAFASGDDVHSATAAKLFGVPVGEVSAEQRRKAKTVNFGIIYGISPFGLSERMDISVGQAKEFILQYFKTYPGVSAYISKIIDFARVHKYVETLYGRRRYLNDILSRNTQTRQFNERNAVNAPLQGSAADIIKIAMNNIRYAFEQEGLKSKMILQVHDELVFDTAKDELEKVMSIVQREMNSVVKLKVPLIAECGYGKNWLEAH